MTPVEAALPRWNESDLAALLTLDEVAPLRYRSRYGDANLNGRAYGGQVLGQAMMAACLSVDPSRAATMMQFLFLQGTDPEWPVDFEVSVSQDGKRFSSRHVSGTQGGKPVLDATATSRSRCRRRSTATCRQRRSRLRRSCRPCQRCRGCGKKACAGSAGIRCARSRASTFACPTSTPRSIRSRRLI